MQNKDRKIHRYFINLICPAVVFGCAAGVLTAVAVTLYKFLAERAIELSAQGYGFLRENPIWLGLALAALAGLAALLAAIYRRHPNLRGGGIPTSAGILRGEISFRWVENLVGVTGLSLVSFLVGVPLGTEGPAVQIGTAIGRGSLGAMSRKHRAWDRYAMTGGACAGFAAATGAPISGVLFALEEAHKSISPMILMVSAVAVIFAEVTSELISPLFGVNARLFERVSLPVLQMEDMWMPLVIGAAVGLFSTLFLKFYRWIRRFFGKTLGRASAWTRMWLVFIGTAIAGLCSGSLISTGHHVVEEMFTAEAPVYLLLIFLFIRMILTLSASSNGITGGLFLPMMALGAILAAALGRVLLLAGLHESYFGIIVMLGITACIAGMMKTPVTAILFSIEVLSLGGNILPVLIAAAASYIITEVFRVRSINDTVLDSRMEELHAGGSRVYEGFAAVQQGSFAEGKQMRDVLWPSGLLVLSIHRRGEATRVDVHGETVLREGDVLHLRYSTRNEGEARGEILAILGEQEFTSSEQKEV